MPSHPYKSYEPTGFSSVNPGGDDGPGTHENTVRLRRGHPVGPVKPFEATGFFRVEKEDRWWLVTPEGNAFLSFGINHLYPDLWNQDYNREAWQKKLGLRELYYGPDFFSALRAWFMETCQDFGFNTVGVHTSLQVVNTPQPEMAYMQPIYFVDIPHWKTDVPDSNFVDVFAPAFEQHCDRMAKEIVVPVRDDPFLLGYAMTDCTLFTEEDLRERPDVIGGKRRKSRIGWPRRLRNLGASAPGKQAYVQIMQQVYRVVSTSSIPLMAPVSSLSTPCWRRKTGDPKPSSQMEMKPATT